MSEAARTKDFGRLVEMVLEGRGDDIRDWSATTADADGVDEEVQEFVDNVPAFQVLYEYIVYIYSTCLILLL